MTTVSAGGGDKTASLITPAIDKNHLVLRSNIRDGSSSNFCHRQDILKHTARSRDTHDTHAALPSALARLGVPNDLRRYMNPTNGPKKATCQNSICKRFTDQTYFIGGLPIMMMIWVLQDQESNLNAEGDLFGPRSRHIRIPRKCSCVATKAYLDKLPCSFIKYHCKHEKQKMGG